MTDPHKNAAPEAPSSASVEQPATGDASPNARPTRVASPVVTVRPSASPVAQMVQSQEEPTAGELHRSWMTVVDLCDRRLAELATHRDTPDRRLRLQAVTSVRDDAAARAYSYAVQAERAEKAGEL